MTFVLVLSWLLFGLIVGLIARVLAPGTQSMGLVATTCVGLAGSVTGGVLGNVFMGVPVLGFHGAGMIGSVLGALVVLVLVGLTRKARSGEG